MPRKVQKGGLLKFISQVKPLIINDIIDLFQKNEFTLKLLFTIYENINKLIYNFNSYIIDKEDIKIQEDIIDILNKLKRFIMFGIIYKICNVHYILCENSVCNSNKGQINDVLFFDLFQQQPTYNINLFIFTYTESKKTKFFYKPCSVHTIIFTLNKNINIIEYRTKLCESITFLKNFCEIPFSEKDCNIEQRPQSAAPSNHHAETTPRQTSNKELPTLIRPPSSTGGRRKKNLKK